MPELLDVLRRYPRQAGYYIVGSVRPCPVDVTDPGASAAWIGTFDVGGSPPSWSGVRMGELADSVVSVEAAASLATAALRGGGAVGHLRDTMPAEVAEQVWRTFVASFSGRTTCYAYLQLGSRRSTSSSGVVVATGDAAGVLWVVESD